MSTKRDLPRKGTLLYALASCDWSDLTIAQIAEVLNTGESDVSAAMSQLKKSYGIAVAYQHPESLTKRLLADRDLLKDMTYSEIAEKYGSTVNSISSTFRHIRKRYGVTTEHRRSSSGRK